MASQHEQMSENSNSRVDCRIPVDLLLNKYVDGRPHIVRASDISRNGFRLHRVLEPKTNNDAVGLQFALPGSDRVITCAGKIVRRSSDNAVTGVEFTHVAPEHQELIDAFVAHNEPE